MKQRFTRLVARLSGISETDRLFWGAFFVWLTIYATWYAYALYSDVGMDQVQRHLALRGAKLFTMIPALIFSAFLFDLFTPGDWMEKVGEDANASSRVVIALILAVAYCVR